MPGRSQNRTSTYSTFSSFGKFEDVVGASFPSQNAPLLYPRPTLWSRYSVVNPVLVQTLRPCRPICLICGSPRPWAMQDRNRWHANGTRLSGLPRMTAKSPPDYPGKDVLACRTPVRWFDGRRPAASDRLVDRLRSGVAALRLVDLPPLPYDGCPAIWLLLGGGVRLFDFTPGQLMLGLVGRCRRPDRSGAPGWWFAAVHRLGLQGCT